MGKIPSLWDSKDSRKLRRNGFNLRTSTCKPKISQEREERPFQMMNLFTQARGFSASLWSYQQLKKMVRFKKEERRRKRASQSTNNLVRWALSGGADGSVKLFKAGICTSLCPTSPFTNQSWEFYLQFQTKRSNNNFQKYLGFILM